MTFPVQGTDLGNINVTFFGSKMNRVFDLLIVEVRSAEVH